MEGQHEDLLEKGSSNWQPKKLYTTPALIVYGTATELTLLNGSKIADNPTGPNPVPSAPSK